MRHRQDLVKALFAISGQTSEATMVQVVAELQPTAQQRLMLAHLWQQYADKVRQLREEQAGLMRQMQELAAQQVTPVSLGDRSLQGMVGQYLALIKGAGKLTVFQDAKFLLLIQLMSAYARVFSMIQKARSAAAAYPVFPDIIRLIRMLVEAEGQEGGEADSSGAQAQAQQQQPPQGGGQGRRASAGPAG